MRCVLDGPSATLAIQHPVDLSPQSATRPVRYKETSSQRVVYGKYKGVIQDVQMTLMGFNEQAHRRMM